jgi:hypothetical protein
MSNLKESNYGVSHLTDFMFAELERKYEGHNPRNKPELIVVKGKKKLKIRGSRKISFGYEGVTYLLQFKAEEDGLYVVAKGQIPRAQLRSPLSGPDELVHILKQAEFEKDDTGKLTETQKWPFMDRTELGSVDEGDVVYVDIKKRLKQIPLGEQGHLSGNIYRAVMQTLIAPINQYLHPGESFSQDPQKEVHQQEPEEKRRPKRSRRPNRHGRNIFRW